MNILVVVDMQKDFIDGALGTKEAVAIVPGVVDKIRGFEGQVIATRYPRGGLSGNRGRPASSGRSLCKGYAGLADPSGCGRGCACESGQQDH